jgi:hypothetical protein
MANHVMLFDKQLIGCSRLSEDMDMGVAVAVAACGQGNAFGHKQQLYSPFQGKNLHAFVISSSAPSFSSQIPIHNKLLWLSPTFHNGTLSPIQRSSLNTSMPPS